MLDFTLPFAIGFTVLFGAIFLAFLAYSIVFIVKRRYPRNAWDIIFRVLNFILIAAVAFVLVAVVLQAHLAVYALSAVFTLLPILGVALTAIMGTALVAAALVALILCAILHLAVAKKPSQQELQARNDIKEARRALKKAVSGSSLNDEIPTTDEPSDNNVIKLGGEVDSIGKTGADFNREFLQNADDEALEPMEYGEKTLAHIEEVESMMRQISVERQEQELSKPQESDEFVSANEYINPEQDNQTIDETPNTYDSLAAKVFAEVREFAKTEEIIDDDDDDTIDETQINPIVETQYEAIAQDENNINDANTSEPSDVDDTINKTQESNFRDNNVDSTEPAPQTVEFTKELKQEFLDDATKGYGDIDYSQYNGAQFVQVDYGDNVNSKKPNVGYESLEEEMARRVEESKTLSQRITSQRREQYEKQRAQRVQVAINQDKQAILAASIAIKDAKSDDIAATVISAPKKTPIKQGDKKTPKNQATPRPIYVPGSLPPVRVISYKKTNSGLEKIESDKKPAGKPVAKATTPTAKKISTGTKKASSKKANNALFNSGTSTKKATTKKTTTTKSTSSAAHEQIENSRKYVLVNRGNATNIFDDYLKKMNTVQKEKLEGAMSHIEINS